MQTRFTIAIVGGGPAGISAAVHAARRNVSHVLLERNSQLFGTVLEFPKSKLVMAAPESGSLLSDLPFEAGSRDSIIAGWAEVVRQSGVNVCLNAEVIGIRGEEGNFEISLAGMDTIRAEYVIMAIGLHGNARKLTIPGAEENPRVYYRTDDPDEIAGEDIIIVGNGDSAIEDALALAERNQVTMVYRAADFGRVHPTNLRRLQNAIRQGTVRTYAHCEPRDIRGQHLSIAPAA